MPPKKKSKKPSGTKKPANKSANKSAKKPVPRVRKPLKQARAEDVAKEEARQKVLRDVKRGRVVDPALAARALGIKRAERASKRTEDRLRRNVKYKRKKRV